MAEKEEVIIEVTIDTDKALKDTQRLKEEQANLKNELKELKKTEGELSEAYIKKEAELKAVNKQLATNQNQLAAIESTQRESLGTIEKLQARNAALNAEKKKLNATDEDYAKRLKEINDEMDRNNEELKATGNQAQKQAANIGNYKSALDALPPSMQGGIEGFKGMAAQAKAFLLNPVALTIAAIVGALLLLKKSLSGTEEGQNKMNKIMGIFTGVINGLMKVLRPLANFLADYIIKYFETLGMVAEKAMNLIADGLAALGFEGASKAVKDFGNEMKETAKNAQLLVEAEAQFTKMQRDANRIMLDYQKQAEKLRQIRDDESKSIPERIRANEELGKVLKEQLAKELEIANQGLKVAELRIQAEGESTEALDERAAALERISDINERITGQESEYLANLNSLRKEATALQQEANDKRKQATDEQIKYELEQAQKLQEEKIKGLQIELDIYLQINQSKIDGSKELTDELIAEEKRRLDEINKLQKEQLTTEYNQSIEALKKQLADKTVNQTVYEATLKNIQEQYRLDNLTLDAQMNEQKKSLDDTFAAQKLEALNQQYEFERSLLEGQMFAEFEMQTADLMAKQQQDLDFANATIKDEEKKKQIIDKINKKYAKATLVIENAKYQAIGSLASNFANNIATIAGENTKVGKAAAVAATTIQTIQSGVAAFSGMVSTIPGPVGIGLGIAAAAAALVSGYASVKKILSVQSGLPGDGGVSASGGGGATPPSITATIPQSVNPELGQGIVSREVAGSTQQSQQQTSILQPTLVTDQVTINQSKDLAARQTQTL